MFATASFWTICFAFLNVLTTAFGAAKVENLHSKKLIYFYWCNLFLNHGLQKFAASYSYGWTWHMEQFQMTRHYTHAAQLFNEIHSLSIFWAEYLF